MDTLKDKVIKTLEILDKVAGDVGAFSADAREFIPRHFTYGGYVSCILVVEENGAVRDYSDCDPSDRFESMPCVVYPSLEEWAWQMTMHHAEMSD